MSKLYSIGELLIDFQSVGVASLKETKEFVKKAGGAPANVCVQAQKLGHQTVYLTKVGDDAFGEFLIETLKNEGVDTTYVSKAKEYETSLAFVSFTPDGEREFSFFRKKAADLYFTEEDFKDVAFSKGDVLEFGSVALQTEVAKNTHKYLINKAKESGATICFDPNLRFNLWDDKNELRNVVNEFLEYADVVKVGDEEIDFITNKTGEESIKAIMRPNVKILVLTKGKDGATIYLKDGRQYSCPGYKVKAIDTTGAGDSFFGGFIAQLLDNNLNVETLLNKEIDYQSFVNFSCKCGAYTTTGYGAIPSMGNKEVIEKVVK